MNWYEILVIAHIIGTALGVGGVVIADTLFFRAIKNDRVEDGTIEIWKMINSVIWTGFILLFVSGVLLFVVYRFEMPTRLALAFGSKFWLKMFIVGVLFVDGLTMHWKALPLLSRVASEGGKLSSSRFFASSKLFFAMGAVSMVSWLATLILGSVRRISLNFWEGLMVYFGLLIAAIVVSQIVRGRVHHFLLSKS